MHSCLIDLSLLSGWQCLSPVDPCDPSEILRVPFFSFPFLSFIYCPRAICSCLPPLFGYLGSRLRPALASPREGLLSALCSCSCTAHLLGVTRSLPGRSPFSSGFPSSPCPFPLPCDLSWPPAAVLSPDPLVTESPRVPGFRRWFGPAALRVSPSFSWPGPVPMCESN